MPKKKAIKPSKVFRSITTPELDGMVRNNPSGAVDVLLDTPFWLSCLSTERSYRRDSDDTDGYHRGILVTFGGDGDAWVQVQTFRTDPDTKRDVLDFHDHRFRTGFGGGRSLRVRTALMILARAIELDEGDRPDRP